MDSTLRRAQLRVVPQPQDPAHSDGGPEPEFIFLEAEKPSTYELFRRGFWMSIGAVMGGFMFTLVVTALGVLRS